ncbi:DUF4230 domain-containing protein [Adlercreutzia equolifaciens]|uniref:DUF4230 domain-containing protein n=1 Tax=Adlercreutzia equolifaciens TaxID=446660 RepID=UPI0023AEAA71|nr:DUF4230 domain-containing protein [Adlercreutzia equolifaciens]MDE8702264.1 DUF4230 domain-containing protein [Adlercreutzia equolifaciens]
MKEIDGSESADSKAREIVEQAADKAATAAKDAANQFANKATDVARDAARGLSDEATKAALGVVGKAQKSLEQRLSDDKDGSMTSASQRKAPTQKKGTADKTRRRKAKGLHPAAKIAIVIGASAVVLLAVLFAVLGPGQSSFFDKEDFVTSAQLEKAVDIDELSTAEFVYNGIAEKCKENGEVDFRISYDAKVKAGIKMSEVTFEVDNVAKKVYPHLPKVDITNIEVDTDQLSYMPENPDGDLKEILKICEQDIANEASDAEDFEVAAEENLRAVIEALTNPILKGKGYTLEWSMSEEV